MAAFRPPPATCRCSRSLGPLGRLDATSRFKDREPGLAAKVTPISGSGWRSGVLSSAQCAITGGLVAGAVEGVDGGVVAATPDAEAPAR